MEIFDEDIAVKYILAKLAENPRITTKYNADDILEVIDLIWDYYEDNGMLDIDMEVEDEVQQSVDISAMSAWVTKMIKKDRNSRIKQEDIQPIIMAELEYEKLCE